MINVLHLGLSYKCNMKCSHCFVDKKRDILTENDFYNIIDLLYDEGLFVMYYTYGEPLYSELFPLISEYAKKKGIVQILMTNGTMVDEKMIKMFKERCISKVCVSIDDIDENKHDANRNYKGAYSKAIEALKLLTGNDIVCEMSVTVRDDNVKCLQEIYNLAIKMKIPFVSFLRERQNGKLRKLKDQEMYEKFFEKMLRNPKSTKVMFHDLSLLPILSRLKSENKIDEKTFEKYFEMNSCHCERTLSIAPNGDVRKCNLTSRIMGNITEMQLSEILEKKGDNYEDIICCSAIS